jgi:hypothetical protein
MGTTGPTDKRRSDPRRVTHAVSTLVIIGVLTLYGYITSRAGEPVFSRLVNDPAES